MRLHYFFLRLNFFPYLVTRASSSNSPTMFPSAVSRVDLADAPQPSPKRRKRNDHDSRLSAEIHAADGPVARPGKVRGANLPQEYELMRLIAGLQHPHAAWNTSTPACEWPGVMCKEQTIIQIDWGHRSLFGSMQWECLPKSLEKMKANSARLNGTLPLDMMPPNLVLLYLFTNELSGELDLRHLPTSMRKLCVGDNKFEGEVDLTQLPPNFAVLTLQMNELSGEICLSEFPQTLRILYIGNNEFTGALDLSHLPPLLEELDAQYTEFEGTVLLDSLPKSLDTLNLDGCAVCGEIKEENAPSNLSIDGTDITVLE